jgi:hypothetical protein
MRTMLSCFTLLSLAMGLSAVAWTAMKLQEATALIEQAGTR